MKKLAQALSAAALIATIVPPCMFFADALSLSSMKTWMLYSMVLWFVAAPLWMQIKPNE